MNKALRCAALALALMFAALIWPLAGARTLASAYHSEIRVLLSIGSRSSLKFTPVGKFTLAQSSGLALGEEELTVSVVGARVSITASGKTVTASKLTLVNSDYGGRSAYIRLRNSEHGTCTYLGNITFSVYEGKLRAINTLPLEQYIYGVIPNEMSNSFPLEALKAQAVCARSYATAKCSRYASRAYDLGDTSNDQVYCGYASKNRRAIAAVDATAGQVLTYEGDIIEAFYSSSNGGQTERSGNVWSEDHPYYINADDPFDLLNPSSMEYLAFIPAVFNEDTVAAMDRDVYSALLRAAEAAAGEGAQLIGTAGVMPTGAKYDAPSRAYATADVALIVKPADGREGQITATLTLDALLYGAAENTLGAFGAKNYTLRLRGAERATRVINGVEYGGWNLTMRRYGHGIGLSQRGAQQRARMGESYLDILAFYYVGTSLATVGTWESAPRITSGEYRITREFMAGIAPGTKPAALLAALSVGDGGVASLVTSRGELKIESEATTGNFVRVTYGNGDSFLDLPIVIYGDLDGEGGLSVNDAQLVAEHLSNERALSGPYLEAADVDRDGEVTSKDLLYIIRAIRGDERIVQK